MGRLFISRDQDKFTFKAVGQKSYQPSYENECFEIMSVTYEEKTHYRFASPERTESLDLNGEWLLTQGPFIEQVDRPKRVTVPPEHLTSCMIEEVQNDEKFREFRMTRYTDDMYV